MSRLSDTLYADTAEILAAARKLTHHDNGKTFYLNLAGGFNVDLPAPELGLKFKFVVKTAPTTAYTITARDIAGTAANIIKGHPLNLALHLACTLPVFALARRLARTAAVAREPPVPAPRADLAGALAAALWALAHETAPFPGMANLFVGRGGLRPPGAAAGFQRPGHEDQVALAGARRHHDGRL